MAVDEAHTVETRGGGTARAGGAGLVTYERLPFEDPRRRWWPSPGGVVARAVVLAAVLAFALLIPQILSKFGAGDDTFVPVAITAVVYSIVGLSMNLLLGYTGQVSLGHDAFLGIGAFGAGFVLTEAGLPWGVAAVAAMATGAAAALILGGIALRVRGLYLALVTIAYALFAREVIFNVRSVTRGGAGMPAPRPSFATSHIEFFYFALAVLAIVWLIDWRLTASKLGRAIQALRDDERVAASWGINVTAFKLLAFTLSGIIAGLAGALFAGIEQIVVAPSFSFQLGLIFLLMTVVGGVGSRAGVIQGSIVFASLGTVLDRAHDKWAGGLWIGSLVQFVVGLLVLGGGVALLRLAPRFQRSWTRGLGVVGGVGVGTVGLLFAVSGFTEWFVLWEVIDALWEPFIGALLLLLVLIFFPGGIAQQQEHLLRWLHFRPFLSHGDEAHTGAPEEGSHADA